MTLSNDQIEIIERRLRQSIASDELYKDLLDHLCCATESEMDKGKKFEDALLLVSNELAPDGFMAIQLETTLLLNFNKIINMKRFIYTTGFLSVVTFVIGWTFSLLRIAGGAALSIGGFLVFAVIFLPLMTRDHFRFNKQLSSFNKAKYVMGMTASSILALSVTFKWFHLEGANLLLVFGTGFGVLGFLPFAFISMYRKSVSASEQQLV
jgi:hypothetical protein